MLIRQHLNVEPNVQNQAVVVPRLQLLQQPPPLQQQRHMLFRSVMETKWSGGPKKILRILKTTDFIVRNIMFVLMENSATRPVVRSRRHTS